MNGFRFTIGVAVLLCMAANSRAAITVKNEATNGFVPLVSSTTIADILIDRNDARVVEIASLLLAEDIESITGKRPKVFFSDQEVTSDTVVIAGTLGISAPIDQLVRDGRIDVEPIRGRWEASIVVMLDDALPGGKKAIVVVGSDRRGTAYGLMDISRAMGVSPWVWWADVTPTPQKELYIASVTYVEDGPDVKFRGIFINDEGWSLRQWAANTFDPESKSAASIDTQKLMPGYLRSTVEPVEGNIGPKTYRKIFELMLRLKSNLLWPAMHEGTLPFNHFPENTKWADDYAVIMGSSHCEPMLRNNASEWRPDDPRSERVRTWNYFTNRDDIYDYWDKRVEANRDYENIYTVGIRGVHDGGMAGGKNVEERVSKLEKIFSDQREILRNRLGKNSVDVPQIFCPYKEVFTLYEAGLEVPDDIILCWADDNQGYMRRLPNAEERKRSGGHGLYYHLSYWSDYLWLSSMSPQLMAYELTKAADYGVNRLWVFNVGDIKITEKEMEFAMDLAWDIEVWGPDRADTWASAWAGRTFGNTYAGEIGHILNEFYRLAYRGKPEHIGHVGYSREEIERRLEAYGAIAKQCDALRKNLPERLQDAFTHLVYYPVVACKYHNDKILLSRLSHDAAESGNASGARALAAQAEAAWDEVKSLTDEYNATSNGKWERLMSWHPRNLKVFFMPPVATEEVREAGGVESGVFPDEPAMTLTVDKAVATGNGDGSHVLSFVQGLSIDGVAAYITPHASDGIPDSDVDAAPFLDFKLALKKGSHVLRVKCLPTHAVGKDRALRFAIATSAGPPSIHDVDEEESAHHHGGCRDTLKLLSEPCVDGFVSRDQPIKLDRDQEVTVRISILDPAFVLYRLEVYNL